MNTMLIYMQLLTKSELESQHEQIASNVSLVQSYAHSELEKKTWLTVRSPTIVGFFIHFHYHIIQVQHILLQSYH